MVSESITFFNQPETTHFSHTVRFFEFIELVIPSSSGILGPSFCKDQALQNSQMITLM